MPNEKENTEEVKDQVVDKTAEETTDEVVLPAVELDDTDIEVIESSVLTQNEGKTKEELAEEIEAAKQSYVKEQQEILVKLDEIKEREGNAEMSDDEAFAIYEKELESEEGASKKTVTDNDNPFESINTNVDEKGAGADSPEVLSQRLKEYESTLSDPAIKEFIEFRKSGGDISSFIAKQGRVVDYSSLSPKDVFLEYLDNEVASGQLTEEEKENEIEVFDSKESIIEKKAFVAPLREELVRKQNEKLSSFMAEPAMQRKNQEEISRKAEAELNTFADQLKGKKYRGWEIPESAIVEAKNDLRSGKFSFVNQDGSPNVGLIMEAYLAIKHRDDIDKANVERGRTKGVRSEVQKRSLPKRGTGVTTRSLSTKGGLDAAYEEAKAKRKKEKGINL